jgi:hypothetical protein
MEQTIIVTGDEKIADVRLLAVRSALRLEITTGLKRHGRSANTIANEIMGTSYRVKRVTYMAFNAYITEKLGADFSQPL